MTQCHQAERRAWDRVMCWDPTLPAEMVERLWHDPAALLADGERLQHKPSCTVVRIDGPSGPLVLKHHVGGGLRKLRRAMTACSPARKAWIDGRFLLETGIPTPPPRAVIEQRVGPFKTSSYFLADYVPGRSLYRLMRYERPAEAYVRDLARQVAAIWQQLDELAVCHNDFKTENLLVDPQGKVWLIDVDRMLRFRRREQARQRQPRDAADLLHERNWRSDPAAAETFRAAILQTDAAREAVAARHGDHRLNRPAPAANNPSHLVTAIVPCHNAAGSIRACLESLRDVADEILIADADSTDDTIRIVRDFGGCRIIERAGPADASFERWAHGHARHPWILRVLPEERLNPELGRQVQDVAASDPQEDGFRIWRAIYFQGRRLKHGGFQHDSSIRLYRRDAAQFETRNGRVEIVVPSKKLGQLASRIIYEACPSAETPNQTSPHKPVTWRTAWPVFRSYLLRLGCLDGRAGLQAAYWSALAPQRSDR